MELVAAVVVEPVCWVVDVVKVTTVLVALVDVVVDVKVVLVDVVVTSFGAEIESNRVKKLFPEIYKLD